MSTTAHHLHHLDPLDSHIQYSPPGPSFSRILWSQFLGKLIRGGLVGQATVPIAVACLKATIDHRYLPPLLSTLDFSYLG